jgi:hypothetical protein
VGPVFELLPLLWYGFGSQQWMMWSAGVLASVSSISYPAISAFVSMHADADKQGLVQGMITGIRGLCNGLGPAMFGLIFYLFHVDLNEKGNEKTPASNVTSEHHTFDMISALMPGPPFVFGAFLVILAILVAAFIPDTTSNIFASDDDKKHRRSKDDERGRKRSGREEVIKLSDDSVTTDSEDDYNVPLIKEDDLLL